MLIGSYRHAIDEKGRVFIPAKWRDELQGGFILTRGTSGCIFGLPFREWESLMSKLATLPLSDRRAQNIQRNLTRWANECESDKQGRVVIPPRLRELAEIREETELIGMNNHFEMWDPGVLDALDQQQGQDYDASLAAAAELGI